MALNRELDAADGLDKKRLLAAIDRSIIAEARLTGTYQR
jgi:phosphatidylethanolamine-binding protein (PEBP) family uncharacterized protein